jgi:TfoX/Sxy family transcriptional regulator of competence genes
MGQAEDEIRMDAEDALAAIDGLEVRRMFSGWGFYRHGLLFAAAWDGELRFRTRQDGRWIYEEVDRDLLDRPDELVTAAREVLTALEREPAARKPKSRPARRSQQGRPR